jgi:hypothetical protein
MAAITKNRNFFKWPKTALFYIYRDPLHNLFSNIKIDISHTKYIKDGKVLAHSWLRLKVLPGSLTDLSALVG